MLLQFRAFLTETQEENVIRRVVLSFPDQEQSEFIVGFTRGDDVYHDGEAHVENAEIELPSLDWIQTNVGLEVEEFPVRIACTGSMRPVIDCGDEVIFEPARFGDPLKVDDIITFRHSPTDIELETDCPAFFNAPSFQGTEYIIHRIIQVMPEGSARYVTKGDNNREQDACVVKEESIIFRVVEVNQDVYVIDQEGYDQYVEQYQALLL
ncbi:MAG: hypothetical protein ACE5Q6_05970, partial [Dehalococcoidia bacterium]